MTLSDLWFLPICDCFFSSFLFRCRRHRICSYWPFQYNSSDIVRMEWWSIYKTVLKCCVSLIYAVEWKWLNTFYEKATQFPNPVSNAKVKKLSLMKKKKKRTNGKFRFTNHKIEKCFEQEALVLLLLCIQCHSMWIMRSIEWWQFEYVNAITCECFCVYGYGRWNMIADAITKSTEINENQ